MRTGAIGCHQIRRGPLTEGHDAPRALFRVERVTVELDSRDH